MNFLELCGMQGFYCKISKFYMMCFITSKLFSKCLIYLYYPSYVVPALYIS